ncbi:MAG TPA: DUF1616 domain-containing protein [Dehalococcoidia bacterium]|nr:DUF1616 domain-containing protein [Dehalococcoidia bacterium]
MRLRTWTDLIVLNLLVLLLVIIILSFPTNVVRIILGIPFVLFFPGYILVTALFPRKESINNVLRLVLSLGLSIVIVPLIGLILNYTPWGIALESVLGSITAFILVMSVVTWVRRKQLPEEDRFGIAFHLRMPGWEGGIWDKVLTVMLVVSVLGAMAAVAYTIVTPGDREKFTEFYILGAYGEAVDFPQSVKAGQEVEVTVGIINQEGETTSYRVEISINGIKNNELDGLTVEPGETWQGTMSFILDTPGDNQRVEFLLFKNEEAEPRAGPLYLEIDVSS